METKAQEVILTCWLTFLLNLHVCQKSARRLLPYNYGVSIYTFFLKIFYFKSKMSVIPHFIPVLINGFSIR